MTIVPPRTILYGNPATSGRPPQKALMRDYLEGLAARLSAIETVLPAGAAEISSIASADWQPATPTQVTAFRAVMNDIADFSAAHDKPVAEVIVLGDVVHEASQDDTGAAPDYGFADLMEDWAARNLPELVLMPGNHDRDGTGDNDHETNWSYQTWAKFFGPLFFGRVRGNTLWLFLGDMAGSTGGEQTDAALTWFERALDASDGYNVIVGLHQPLYGAWGDSVADYLADGWPAQQDDITEAYQWWSQRIATAIAARDNVAAVLFGHVGSDGYAASTEVNEAFGTTHIGVQMGLERAARAENGGAVENWPNHYAVIDWAHGASTITLRRRDAKTAGWISGSTVTITPKYPVSLRGAVFDGRQAAARMNAVIDKTLTVHEDLSAQREEVSEGVWETVAGIRWMLHLMLAESALDDSAPGHGPGLVFHIPGSTTDYDDNGNVIASAPGSAPGGGIAAVRDRGTDGDLWGNVELYAADPLLGSGVAALKKVLIGHGDVGTVELVKGLRTVALTSADDLDALGTDIDGRCMIFATWGSDGVPANAPSGLTFGAVIHIQSGLTSKSQMLVRRSGTGGIWTRNYTSGAWRAARRLDATSTAASVTVTAATHTVADDDRYLRINRAGAVTLTLPDATAIENHGRRLEITVQQAYAVTSASANVVPATSGTAGTAILPDSAGASVLLVSDGTNWRASHAQNVTADFANLQDQLDDLNAAVLIGDEDPALFSVGDDLRAILSVDEDDLRHPAIDDLTARARRASYPPHLYLDGDSRSDLATNVGRTRTQGWAGWLQSLARGRFDLNNDWNMGVGGQDSSQMRFRAGLLAGLPPGVVVCICSTNDRTGTGQTAEWTIENLADYQDRVLRYGHRLVWIAETPRGDTANPGYDLSATQVARMQRVRQWILDQAYVAGVHVVDPWPVMADASRTDGRALDTMLRDGIHWGAFGAYTLALAMQPLIEALFPPRDRLAATNADLFGAENPTGALHANPMLTGTAGTASTGCTGDVATDWTATAGAGLAAVCSKITAGGHEWQRLVVSGGPTGTGTTDDDGNTDASPVSVILETPLTDLDSGDVIEGAVEFAIAAGASGLRGVSMYLEVETAGGSILTTAMEPDLIRSQINLNYPDEAVSGVLVTPRYTVPGTVTAARVYLAVTGANFVSSALTLSATVDFRAAKIRKVI